MIFLENQYILILGAKSPSSVFNTTGLYAMSTWWVENAVQEKAIEKHAQEKEAL
jgi:hypothetical protein